MMQLSRRLGYSDSIVGKWISREEIPENALLHIESLCMPRETFDTIDDSSNQNELTIKEQNGEADTHLPGHPPQDEFHYLQKVSEILRSGHQGVIEALKSNIVTFHETVHVTDRLQALEEQRARDETEMRSMRDSIQRLERDLKREQNFDDGSAARANLDHAGNDDT